MDIQKVLYQIIEMIEENRDKKIIVEKLAKQVNVSAVHLHRMFKLVFECTLAEYIRARKLCWAAELLMKTKQNVDAIAYEVGFEHESSFIRSFQREFGVSPGRVRKEALSLEITPPLNMKAYQELEDGMLSAMEIVLVPAFTIIGKKHRIQDSTSITDAPKVAIDFVRNNMKQINYNPQTFIGFTEVIKNCKEYTHYTTSVITSKDTVVPEGMHKIDLESSYCARFRYIGNHSVYKMNRHMAAEMYEKIWEFVELPYIPLNYFYERIEAEYLDKDYCVMEWYTPVELN